MKEDILRLLELAKEWNSDRPAQSKQPFSIIPRMYERISTKELLHSEIIAELLRPDGAHKCGDIFLQKFMRSIGIDPQAQDFSKVELKTEAATDESRRIDILIVWGNNAVIIENKLNNAVDQPDQLKDYLKDTEHKGKKVLKMVYIPLFAWKRVQEYISADVVCLYPGELSEWLKDCAKRNSDAREVVSPYIQLLDYMNQSNQNYMKAQELYELLEQDSRLMAAALNIAETLNSGEWVTFLRTQLEDKVKARLNEPTMNKWFNNKESELWLWLGNDKKEHKYWVSVGMSDKYYLFLYYYDEQAKPEGENIVGSGQYDDYYYVQLSDTYPIGNKVETDNLVSKVIELLEKSRK